MGYDNHNTIQNMGSIFYFMLTAIILLILRLVLAIKTYSCFLWTKCKTMVPVATILSSLYMVCYEGYLEIMLSCLLSYFGAIKVNTHDIIAYILAFILPIVLIIVIPAILLFVLSKTNDELESESFKLKYKKIFPNLRFHQHSAVFYSFLFVVRRLLFIVITFTNK